MSQTKITCRACKKTLASVHHGGAVRFTFGVVKTFDPTGPHGPCLWLQCVCGAMRDFGLAAPPGAVKEIAVKE